MSRSWPRWVLSLAACSAAAFIIAGTVASLWLAVALLALCIVLFAVVPSEIAWRRRQP